jgi:precorrin-6B C5,15-methyltransferase / cobalt-precorrin-6B C5,C15-methyltransferase
MNYGELYGKPENWTPPLLALIGMGTGREDLSQRALRWIESAEVLMGERRHLECFPGHAARKLDLPSPLEEAFEQIERLAVAKRTAVLASGDPLFFGIGQRLVSRLGKERVLVFPNVTSVQALFARLGESWTNVKVVSLHGRRSIPQGAWLRELRSHSRVALFTDAERTPAEIARQLLEAGFHDRSIAVGEDLGLPSERVRRLSLEEAAGLSFSPLNLVAILPGQEPLEGSASPPGEPVIGIPENAFSHEAGLITKMEVRAVVLAYLQLGPHMVLWDLGAGSGSVSIEASRLVRLKQAIAVEKNAGRFGQLVENLRRFGCYEIRAIEANAGEVLDGLPDPDRVFIGGSGGSLGEILPGVSRRLRAGGRIVQTAVTLETLEYAGAFWRREGLDTSTVQLQVNRSVPIGKTSRFEALNPVFVISAWRKA